MNSQQIILEMGATAYDDARVAVGSEVCTEISEALEDVERELIFAMARFGKFNSPHEGYAVILEELDEMWDSIKRNEVTASAAEAMQVAAMAVRYLIDVGRASAR